jgi:hypothetical protein
MDNVVDLNSYRFEKGLKHLIEIGFVIQKRREGLYDKFSEAFELEADEDKREALHYIWDSCVSGYLQAKTVPDCIRAQIKLEGYYSEFGELIDHPQPWAALTGSEAR